ncbi:tetraspanin-6-like isoform X2 [Eurosta solidaginis]|uniref:tetraspanin-6-like isoform X2 n=1 Tax=Eurosta solidaginis TaxID=178769 RepID=UPI0035312433
MICTHNLVRRIFWCSNAFCLIVGLIMILLCMIFMNSVLDFHLAYCLFGLITGSLTVLSAIIGYGVMKQSEAMMLWLHCALVTILFLTQLYIVIHFQASNVITSTVENLHLLWEREMRSEGSMASIESRFHCCGLHNYSDYTIANMPLPVSCFYVENDAWVHYNNGCLEKVTFAACRASKALSVAGFTLNATQTAAIFGTRSHKTKIMC